MQLKCYGHYMCTRDPAKIQKIQGNSLQSEQNEQREQSEQPAELAKENNDTCQELKSACDAGMEAGCGATELLHFNTKYCTELVQCYCKVYLTS